MALVILIGLIVAGYFIYKKTYKEGIGLSIMVLAGLLFMMISVYSITSYIFALATTAEMRQEYKALVYKVNTESARDEFGIRNKDIIDEVQEWNTNLAFEKNAQRDFWVGIFVPNIYDEFDFIELED